jgi:hypothetical protein
MTGAGSMNDVIYRCWSIANRPFVIFIMGSVLITSLFRIWDLRVAERQAFRELDKTIIECVYRFSEIDELVTLRPKDEAANKLGVHAGEIWAADAYMKGERWLFKEHEGESIEALLKYLHLMLESYGKDLARIETALDLHDQLTAFFAGFPPFQRHAAWIPVLHDEESMKPYEELKASLKKTTSGLKELLQR